MRAALAKAVRESFEKHLKAGLPLFRRLRGNRLPVECRPYEWAVTESFRLHLLLQLHRSEDSFTLEVGWSRRGRWPEYVSPPVSADEAASAEEMRFRIGLLWSKSADYWWDLVPRASTVPLEEVVNDYQGFLDRFQAQPPIPEVLSRVEPIVDDAFRRIREYAMPYFERVAKASGHHLQLDA